MINIFKQFENDLPPFKEYCQRLYARRNVNLISHHSGAKIIQLVEVLDEAFNPINKTNKKCSSRVTELGVIGFKSIKGELHNEKKATWRYLSSSGSESSWQHCPNSLKQSTLGLEATNDYAESALGGASQQISQYGRIDQSSAAAISDMG